MTILKLSENTGLTRAIIVLCRKCLLSFLRNKSKQIRNRAYRSQKRTQTEQSREYLSLDCWSKKATTEIES